MDLPRTCKDPIASSRVIILGAILAIIGSQAPATTPPTDSLAALVVEAINRNELSRADRIIDTQLANDPESLEWLFFKGMRHYADLFGESVSREALEGMRRHLGRVMELGEQRLDIDADDSVALFYAGGAAGYLGIAYAVDGSMFKGVSTAKKGWRYQEHLIELYPTCYDAYLGPGLMNLMTSAAPWILKPILYLLGLSGTEERAHECLSLAYERGSLVRLEAGTYLAQLFERKKDFASSSKLYLDLLRTYPMRVALCAEAMGTLFRERRYDDIVALGERTLRAFEERRYSFTRSDSSRVASVCISTASAHRLRGDSSASTQWLERYVTAPEYRHLPTWRVHWELADLALARSDTVEAVRCYRAVVAGEMPEQLRERVQKKIDSLTSRRR